jgi:hypothetical protein
MLLIRASVLDSEVRDDTRVTNYGYANGKAYGRQSVLQSRTAVLVDKFGTPTSALLLRQPADGADSHPRHAGLRRAEMADIQAGVHRRHQEGQTIIDIYTLWDPWRRYCYWREVGIRILDFEISFGQCIRPTGPLPPLVRRLPPPPLPMPPHVNIYEPDPAYPRPRPHHVLTWLKGTSDAYGATVSQSAKPDGSWRPSAPCSNRPQPSTVLPLLS